MQRSRLLTTTSVTVAALLLSASWSLPSLAKGDDSGELRQGLPGRRISGGVRMEPPADSCFTDFDQSLVSVLPRNNLGTTVESHPTFWFSLPETTGAKSVEFQLLNESDDLVYRTDVAVADSAGLSEFELPASAPALEIDQNYKWVFSLACNNGSQSPVLGLQGWIRRVTISDALAGQIATASSEDKVFLYGTAGLWQEQVTALVNLRRQNRGDDNLQLAWSSLLASTGLTSEVSTEITERMTIVSESERSTSLSQQAELSE